VGYAVEVGARVIRVVVRRDAGGVDGQGAVGWKADGGAVLPGEGFVGGGVCVGRSAGGG